MIAERKSDCSPVESFIWDKVAKDCASTFTGIKKMSEYDLYELKALCEYELDVRNGYLNTTR